jgi:hypothetical protein
MNTNMTIRLGSRRAQLAAGCLAAAAALAGCSDRPPTGVYGQTTALLQHVRSDFKALNLSPGDSRKLTVTAYDAGGAVMSEPVSVTFTSSSTTRVTVAADGTVNARAITEEPVSIIVAGTVGQVTQFDTVLVNVTDPPAAPAVKLTMYFDGDSTGLGAGGSNQLHGALLTAAGDTLPDMLVVFNTRDPRVALPSRYQRDTYVQGIAPGKTWLYGTATLGAQTFVDSIYVHVGWAAEAYMGWNYAGRWGYGSLQVVLQPGGVVWWYNWGSDLASAVTFDDPAAAEADTVGDPSGNIAAFSGGTNPRRFTKPGTYVWHSTDAKGNPQVGQVIVQANPQ